MTRKILEEETIGIIDTNLLLEDGETLKHIEGIAVAVVPSVVIDELDINKSRNDSSGANARRASNMLDSYTEKASAANLNLHTKGIPLGEGRPKLIIHQVTHLHRKVRRLYKKETPDNLIISVALEIQEQVKREEKNLREKGQKVIPKKVVLLSNDTNLRNKARLLKVHAEKYVSAYLRNIDTIYSGREYVSVSENLLSELYENGVIPYNRVRECLGDKTPEPISYEFFTVNGDTHAFFFEDALHLIKSNEKKKVCDCITAKNTEQELVLNLLLNPEVEAVTISGIAGSGKTLLAIAAALHQKESYKKIIITRPVIGLNGQEIGFLPGDEKDKVRPYMQPIYDNIDVIINLLKKKGKRWESIHDLMNDESRFEIQPFALIRGRSFHNSIIIVDEAQNLTMDDDLAIMTRAGEGSKTILIGDPDQTDYHWMDRTNNGLSYLIGKLKGYKYAGNITLIHGVRSRLSEWASKNL